MTERFDYHDVRCPKCGCENFAPAEPFGPIPDHIMAACSDCGEIFKILRVPDFENSRSMMHFKPFLIPGPSG